MNKKTRRLLSLLLGGGRYKTLSGAPPLTFIADGAALKSYRIYGAAGGVGDYDENSGKYVIPVTIAGKNEFDGTLISGYYTDSTMTSIGGASGNYKSFKLLLSAGTYTFSSNIPVLIIRYITADSYKSNPTSGRITQTHTFTVSDDGYVSLAFRNAENTPWDDSTTIQIEEAQTATEYEPYHEPIVSTISLDTPLSEGESVSMADTGVQFGTIDGTNILTVGTTVQPSAVEIRGRIITVQTALNMAALSPVSMSMPDGFALMSESEEVVNYADNHYCSDQAGLRRRRRGRLSACSAYCRGFYCE